MDQTSLMAIQGVMMFFASPPLNGHPWIYHIYNYVQTPDR